MDARWGRHSVLVFSQVLQSGGRRPRRGRNFVVFPAVTDSCLKNIQLDFKAVFKIYLIIEDL